MFLKKIRQDGKNFFRLAAQDRIPHQRQTERPAGAKIHHKQWCSSDGLHFI